MRTIPNKKQGNRLFRLLSKLIFWRRKDDHHEEVQIDDVGLRQLGAYDRIQRIEKVVEEPINDIGLKQLFAYKKLQKA